LERGNSFPHLHLEFYVEYEPFIKFPLDREGHLRDRGGENRAKMLGRRRE